MQTICSRKDLQDAIRELLHEHGDLTVEELQRLLHTKYTFGRKYEATRQAVTIHTRRVARPSGCTRNRHGKPVTLYSVRG